MPKKILIIDDEECFRLMMNNLLLQKGFEVIEAYDGLSGLSLLESENPDLVICDLLMPTLTGKEFVDKVLENPKTKHTPILILTGAEDDYYPKDWTFNKDDILKKPVDFLILQEKIANKLNI